MQFTAQQIADLLEGTVEGNPDVTVSNLAKIEEGVPGTLTFLANEKYTPYIYSTQASIAIVASDFNPEKEIVPTLIKVGEPYQAFSKLLAAYNQIKNNKLGISEKAHLDEGVSYGDQIYVGSFTYIGKNTTLGNNVKIHPNTFIGDNVTIGNDVTIYAGVKVYSDCVIGNSCTIDSSTVIGADGFGFTPDADGFYSKVPQIGNVILEDHVDIGAGCTIDRATLGSTILRRGVKLDNQIQVAHNVEIGENTVIAAQAGIAGSTKIGKNCQIGGQVGIVGHITIGNNVRIQAQTGVARKVKDDEVIQGSPALPYGDYNKSYVHFKNLPRIVAQVNKLEKDSNP